MEPAAHTDITGIAIVALAALACGMGLERLRQPAVVGYILAGALLGPSGLGLVHDRAQIDVLAELGVLMLLFLIGMELSLRLFKRLWRLALTAVVLEVGVAVGAMGLARPLFGWDWPLTVLVGFILALSSTAVVIKILENLGEQTSRIGRITVGVLIAQDLAFVPLLLAVDVLGGDSVDAWTAARLVVALAGLGVLIVLLGRGRRMSLPFSRIYAGHPDLRPLTALAFCFGAAALSGVAGLSGAFGAFIAGLVIGNSTERHAMLESAHPIQSVLMMVFFLSVGLLIDFAFVWNNLGNVLALLFVVAVVKTVANAAILRALGQEWTQAFMAGVLLAQIGEFSFLLSLAGMNRGLMTPEDGRLVVAVTVLSLALSPVWVVTARRLQVLTRAGITSLGDLMRQVYGPEAEAVAEAYGGLRRWARVALGKARQARRQRGSGRGRGGQAEDGYGNPVERRGERRRLDAS